MQIELTPQDAMTVQAILRTHAEMQDQRVIPSMELHARMKRDEPGETEFIADLKEQIDTLETDSEDLKRLAELFM